MHQIASMESAIYALGFREYGAQFSDETPEMAAAMARAITFERQRPQLERLRRYESQMNRQANKDQQLLTALQTARKAAAVQQEKDAIALLTHFTTTGESWNPADFGFVLSIDEIRALEERQFLLNRVRTAAKAG